MAGDPPPYEVANADASPNLIFVCDHASNALPSGFAALGMPPQSFNLHIAYDIGAAEVTRAMANAYNAPAILGTYSRLLIDLNRGPDDPTLVMKLSDGAVIPGNARVDFAEIDRRTALYYRPYHDAIEAQIARARSAGLKPVIVSIHSFTPEWRGKKRPWHIGVLWDRKDGRLAHPVMEELRREGDLVVGDNQPYSGELENDCMAQHALRHGFAHALIEIRQDLIADAQSAGHWAARLVPVLRRALERLDSAATIGSAKHERSHAHGN